MMLDLEAIKAKHNSHLMEIAVSVLQGCAAHIRVVEDTLVKVGVHSSWDEDRALAYDVMGAVAEVLVRVIARGKDQAQRKVEIEPLIKLIGETLRSFFIHEATLRLPQTAPVGATPSSPVEAPVEAA